MYTEILPNTEIPDKEILFRYCRPEALPPDQDELPFALFTDGELSCDWSLFQKTPESSYQVVSAGKKVIIAITICDEIRNPKNPPYIGEIQPTWKQSIYYDPVLDDNEIGGKNIAHSVIKGKKKPQVQVIIRDNSTIYKIVQ